MALSICETVSDGSEILVLDGAYHGHTKPLMGLSTYKIRQQVVGTDPVIKPNPNGWVVGLVDGWVLCDLTRLYFSVPVCSS